MESKINNVNLLLCALQAIDIERNKKEFEIKCEMSQNSVKLIGHTKALDVSCVCVLGPAIFREYRFIPSTITTASHHNYYDCHEGEGSDAQQKCRKEESQKNNNPRRSSQSNHSTGQQVPKNAFDNYNDRLADPLVQKRGLTTTTQQEQHPGVTRHQFVVSRSLFHDALKNQSKPIIELKYDPQKQEFSIIGKSKQSEFTTNFCFLLNCSEPSLTTNVLFLCKKGRSLKHALS